MQKTYKNKQGQGLGRSKAIHKEKQMARFGIPSLIINLNESRSSSMETENKPKLKKFIPFFFMAEKRVIKKSSLSLLEWKIMNYSVLLRRVFEDERGWDFTVLKVFTLETVLPVQ